MACPKGGGGVCEFKVPEMVGQRLDERHDGMRKPPRPDACLLRGPSPGVLPFRRRRRGPVRGSWTPTASVRAPEGPPRPDSEPRPAGRAERARGCSSGARAAVSVRSDQVRRLERQEQGADRSGEHGVRSHC